MIQRRWLICVRRIESQEARHERAILLTILGSLTSFISLMTSIPKFLREILGDETIFLCPFLKLTGIPCPFCGLTRSLFSLLSGDPLQAFWYHPLGPLLWGGVLAGGITSFLLSYSQRRLSVRAPRRVRISLIAVSALVVWCTNILYGHH